jgi:hypothetical protein
MLAMLAAAAIMPDLFFMKNDSAMVRSRFRSSHRTMPAVEFAFDPELFPSINPSLGSFNNGVPQVGPKGPISSLGGIFSGAANSVVGNFAFNSTAANLLNGGDFSIHFPIGIGRTTTTTTTTTVHTIRLAPPNVHHATYPSTLEFYSQKHRLQYFKFIKRKKGKSMFCCTMS